MNMFFLYSMLALLSSVSISGQSELSRLADTPECHEWVDSVYDSLSERQRVAQLVVAHLSPEQGAASKAQIKKYVQDNGVGGLLFSKGSINDYATMINYAQSIAEVPLLITLDGEWGLSMRVSGTPRFPHNMGLGAIRDAELMREYGREVARECKAMGIHVNFAPVADVNSNPKNPVIGYRSFGESPKRVAKLVTEYSLGLESGGVMSTAKHFPGHGDTDSDSHKTLPAVRRSRASLDSLDLVPFKAYISAGLSGIMVGHLSLPAIDPSNAPASMSRKITTGLLKEEMGFRGLVFTDGLQMQGATMAENNCVAALQAGADVLLGPRKPVTDIDAVMAALRDGRLSKSEVEASVKKMLAYKYALGVAAQKPVDTSGIEAVLNSPEADALNTKLADASITVIRDKDGMLPIGDLADNSIAIVNIGAAPGNEFDKMCRRYADCDVYDGSALTPQMINEIKEHRTVVCAVYSAGEAARGQMARIKDAEGLVAVFMVDPYKMARFIPSLGGADAIMIAYDDTPYTRRAAAKGLFGGIKVDGRLPVNVAGLAKAGTGIAYQKTRLGFSSPVAAGLDASLAVRVDSAMRASIAAGAFPGAQVIIGRNGDIVFDKNYGVVTKGGAKVDENTIYDLASVSKAVGTLPGIMKAYDLGLFDLDEAASKYVPGMRVEGKDDITVRDLLHHETGIRPSLNMLEIMVDPASYTGKLVRGRRDAAHTLKAYNGVWVSPRVKLRSDITSPTRSEKFNTKIGEGVYVSDAAYDTIMGRIYSSPVYTDRKMRYSCLNFSILMDMEQRLTGLPHYDFVRDSVWGPLGAYNFSYRPADKFPASRFAATENDVVLRKQHLKGYAHDELSAFSGGVQGNAGVFGTAMDVAKLCQAWLNGGKYGDGVIFTEETTGLFTSDKSEKSRRGLGFDKPDLDNPSKSPLPEMANAGVYGHTGFTGTAFWVDPDEDFFMVFLSNRVDPSRNNPAFTKTEIRPTIMRLIYDSIK